MVAVFEYLISIARLSCACPPDPRPVLLSSTRFALPETVVSTASPGPAIPPSRPPIQMPVWPVRITACFHIYQENVVNLSAPRIRPTVTSAGKPANSKPRIHRVSTVEWFFTGLYGKIFRETSPSTHYHCERWNRYGS